jgi:signal transduction histidine kinase
MRTPVIPVENVAEIIWGALLVIYLIGAGPAVYLNPWVITVFGLSAAGAILEVFLRKAGWRWVDAYDSVLWTVLLTAMVVVTGGRSSEVWPAYLLMSLTAPAMGRPPLHYGLMAVNCLAYAGVSLWWNPDGAPFVPGLLLLRIGLFFLVTYVVDRSMARERAAMTRAIAASRDRVSELVSARDAERRRMAGDIHDWLGSGIVAPMRRLELALRAPDADTARTRIGEALVTLQRSHEELRRLMADLHPHLLEQMGLTEALRAHLEGWGDEHGVAVKFTGDSAPQPSPPAALAVYRIMQEALNNVAKHAGATRVEVTLTLRDDGLTLRVADDGRGFAPSGAPAGRGLTGMRERAEAFGGTVAVQSQPQTGTAVVACLRFPKAGYLPPGE